MSRHIYVCVFFFLYTTALAQDQTNFTQFYLNPYTINPSYAGFDGRTAITLIYRKQWSTLDDGPQISNLSFHTPLSQRAGFGLSVINDERGLLKSTGLALSFSYSIPIADESFLRFGISGGGSWNTVDLERLEGFNDPKLGDILDNNSGLTGNAGLSLHLKTFHVGFSLPVVFAPSYISTNTINITEIDPFQSVIFHASNRFYFNNNTYVFEPYLLYRMSGILPPQFEVATILHLNHVLWAGGSYKQDFGISALGGIKLNKTLAIGGSYSIKNSGINELNSPTYEVTLALLVGKHKRGRPMYSFVDTQKVKQKKGTGKSASERLAQKHREQEQARKLQQKQLAKKRQEDIAAKKKQSESQKAEAAQKRKEELASKQAEQRKPAETQRKDDDVVASQSSSTAAITRTDTIVRTHKPRFNQIESSLEAIQIEVTEHSEADEQERLSRLTIHAADPDEPHNETNPYPNADRHDLADIGTNKNEIPVGDYVIIGIFKDESNTKLFISGLKRLGFKANYGYLTKKTAWYVYLHQSSDIQQAKKARDKFRKMKIFRDAWLLTVYPN
ncbi:MAG TPA: PorP/SprF family type IX secretion system membrane protein [Ohtaekwangia sp.]|nr:PorP/SprF family type IX secretion system membrane protein [Ohtaekwangia sp.]